MRICIFGAGAVGGHLGVKLALSGHDVSVVARGAHLDAIRTRGLTLKVGDEARTATVAAAAEPSELGPQDLVFVCVKATALRAIGEQLKPLVSPATGLVFPQNGIPWWYPIGLDDKPAPPELDLFRIAETYLRFMTQDQVIGASIYSANAVVEPGVIANNSPKLNRLMIDGLTRSPVVDIAGVRSVLEAAGIASPAPEGGIRSYTWEKLIFNMSGSTLALATGNPGSEIKSDPELQAAYRRIFSDGLRIAEAHGYALGESVNADTAIAKIPVHKPSLLQDYELGRQMEIEPIVRAPQAFARAAGLDTPALDVIAAVVSRLARDQGLAGT